MRDEIYYCWHDSEAIAIGLPICFDEIPREIVNQLDSIKGITIYHGDYLDDIQVNIDMSVIRGLIKKYEYHNIHPLAKALDMDDVIFLQFQRSNKDFNFEPDKWYKTKVSYGTGGEYLCFTINNKDKGCGLHRLIPIFEDDGGFNNKFIVKAY